MSLQWVMQAMIWTYINRRKIQCMFSYKWDNKKQWWNLFIINTCIHFWNFTTKCDTSCHRLWCPDMAICKSSTAGCEKPPCCHISHNSPLHYHNFAKHTIAVTQFHTSLCCTNTTLESTMHCHATQLYTQHHITQNVIILLLFRTTYCHTTRHYPITNMPLE